MGTKTNRKKTLYIIGGIVAILFTAFIVFCAWFSSHYKGIIKKELPGWVAKASDSLYKISVSDVSINLFTRNVTITNAKLWADTARLQTMSTAGESPATIFTISVPYIEAKGISWAQLAAQKDFSCKHFIVSNPKLQITALEKDSLQQTKTEKKKPAIDKISAGLIEVINPEVVYNNTTEENSFYIKGGDIKLSDWVFEPAKEKDSTRFFYAKASEVNADTFVFKNTSGLYNISTGRLNFSSDDRTAHISNLRLRPNYDKEGFYKKVGHQHDIFNLHFPDLNFIGLDWKSLINKHAIIADSASLNNASIEIYYSRIPPPDPRSKLGNHPNQVLLKLPMPVSIQTLGVKQGHFKYTELNQVSNMEGSFSIEQIHGTAKNITNIPARIQQQGNCVVALQGKFMNGSNMGATFTFPLTDTTGAFAVDGWHKNLVASEIHDAVKALALAEIKNVKISEIKFHIEGNERAATGNLRMLYNDLKIEIQKMEDTGMRGRPFLSFIANKVLIHEHNPEEGEAERTTTMSQQRVPTRSFFNLIWKCMFEGITNLVTRNEDAAKMLQEKKPGDREKKRVNLEGLFKKKDKGN